eukprot:6173289-Pleurochrysis_carterae.AAC.4
MRWMPRHVAPKGRARCRRARGPANVAPETPATEASRRLGAMRSRRVGRPMAQKTLACPSRYVNKLNAINNRRFVAYEYGIHILACK